MNKSMARAEGQGKKKPMFSFLLETCSHLAIQEGKDASSSSNHIILCAEILGRLREAEKKKKKKKKR